MGVPPELELPEKRPGQGQVNFTQPAAPPSPSSCYLLDLLPAPHPHVVVDDLSYISQVLLEDNHQHPAADEQQPFSQILSAANANPHTDSLAITTWPCNSPLQLSVARTPDEYCSYRYSDMINNNVLDSTHVGEDDDYASSSLLMMNSRMQHDGAVEPNRSLPAAAKSSSCCMDVISMAFFKGMEEANKLLPFNGSSDSETTTTLPAAGGRSWKKRLQAGSKDDDDADAVSVGMGRSSKQKVAQAQADSEEEAAAREMLGRMMLDDDDVQQQELIIGSTTSMERDKQARRGAGLSGTAVDLHALLVRCAEAVASNDWQGAVELLQRVRLHSSPAGDGTQRLAHCFAQALEARLMGTGSQMYESLAAKSASAAAILKVYKLYRAACSVLPLGFPITISTTCKAVAGRKKLHVVHYGLGPGFYWPDLLRVLSHREGGPPEVRLTAIDDDPLSAGQLISDCARRFRVPFKFHAVAARSDAVRAEDLGLDPQEVLVVVSHFHFRTLMDESVIIDRPNPRDTVLRNISEMRPRAFIHAILNGSYSGAFFVSRFREALNNFAALFDLMDSTVPRESQSRLLVEQVLLARCTLNIVACEGVDRVERPHSYKQWQARCQRAGLRQLPLDPDIVRATRDKVAKEYRKHVVINEDHGWLLQGWKGRVLSATSTWTAEDDTDVPQE